MMLRHLASLALLVTLLSSSSICVEAQINIAELANLNVISGQLLTPFNSGTHFYINGVRGNTQSQQVIAVSRYGGGSASLQQRYTTGGQTSSWVDMTDNIPGPVMLPWSMNDMVIDILVTAPDGVTTSIYQISIMCDEPALNYPLVTSIEADAPNPLYKVDPNSMNFRIWPNHLGLNTYTVSVTGITTPQCAAHISYYIGAYNSVLDPNLAFGQSTPSSTPGGMVVNVTLLEGRDYMWLLAQTPAGRREWAYYQASPPFTGSAVLIEPNKIDIADWGFCEDITNTVVNQTACNLPYYVQSMTFQAFYHPNSPPLTFYLNGVEIHQILPNGATTSDEFVIPLTVGNNTLVIQTIVTNYTRNYVLPAPNSTTFNIPDLSNLNFLNGQLYPAFNSLTVKSTNFTNGVRGNTTDQQITTVQRFAGYFASVKQRYTTGGLTTGWTTLSYNTPGPILTNWTLNDMLIEILVTAMDGMTQHTYRIQIMCDEPALNTPTLTPIDGSSNPVYPSLPLPYENTYRVWPNSLGSRIYTVNVTGITTPQCAAQISYYIGSSKTFVTSPTLAFDVSNKSSTPGELLKNVTLVEGGGYLYDYLWLLAETPAGRRESALYQAITPLTSSSILISPNRKNLATAKFCSDIDLTVANQTPCTLPYFIQNVTFQAFYNPKSPNITFYLNGTEIHQIITTNGLNSFEEFVIPIDVGSNTLIIQTLVANYTRSFILPQASSTIYNIPELSSLSVFSGQLFPPFTSATANSTNFTNGVRANTNNQRITATLRYANGSAAIQQRFTTGGQTSNWTTLLSGTPGPFMSSWTMNDMLIEIRVTAMDGMTQHTYRIMIVCDEPALNYPLVTSTEAGAPNPLYEDPNSNSTFRIWPNHLGLNTYTVSVTGITTPQCAAHISYYIGAYNSVLDPNLAFGQSTPSSTPGGMVVNVTLLEGRDYMWLLAQTPAGRREWAYYQASPPFTGSDVLIEPNQINIESAGYCTTINVTTADQAVCNLPYYVQNMIFQAYFSKYSPFLTFYMNGVEIHQIRPNGTFTFEEFVIPLWAGKNTLLIQTIVANYTRDYLLPNPSSNNSSKPIRIQLTSSQISIISTQNSFLLLGSLLNSNESQTKESELIWTWSSIPYLNLSTNSPLIISSGVSSSNQLYITQIHQIIDPGMYTFSLFATDPSTSRQANTTVVVEVKPLVETILLQPNEPAPTDPCTKLNPCQNGGVCTSAELTGDIVSTTNNQPARIISIGTRNYTLTCHCLTGEPQFFGSDCSFSILACPKCMTRYQDATQLTVYGIGLDSTLQMRIAGVNVPLQNLRTVNESDGNFVASTLDALANRGLVYSSLTALTFIAPQLISNTTGNTTNTNTTSSRRRRRLLDSSDLPVAIDPSTGQPIDSYIPLLVSAVIPGQSSETKIQFNTMIYYTSSVCLEEGLWKPDGRGGCLDCPAGSFCPGANRVWPLPGYYGYSEYLAPAACRVEEACVGMDIKLATSSANGTASYFAPENEAKKCADGYSGVKCSECSAGYYAQSIHCYFCDSNVDQTAQLTLIAITAATLLVFLSLCVALLTTERLCYVINKILLLQQIATVGVSAAPSLPSHAQPVETFFTWINLLNFDLTLLRPGCGGFPSFTFVSKYFSTLLFMVIASILFFIACCFRLLMNRYKYSKSVNNDIEEKKEETKKNIKKEEEEEEDPTIPLPPDTPTNDFYKRLEHSVLIILSLVYLRVATLICENFLCAIQPDPVLSTASNAVVTESLLLNADGDTLCYHSGHAASTFFSILLLIIYIVGFPLFGFVRLLRSFGSEETHGFSGWVWRRWTWIQVSKLKAQEYAQQILDEWLADRNGPGIADGMTPAPTREELLELLLERDYSDRFGYLYDGLLPNHTTFLVHIFILQALYAAVSVFLSESPLLQLFLFGTLSFLDIIHTGHSMPWDGKKENIQSMALNCITLVQGIALLGPQTNGPKSPFFSLLIIEFVVSVVLITVRLKASQQNQVLDVTQKRIANEQEQTTADVDGRNNLQSVSDIKVAIPPEDNQTPVSPLPNSEPNIASPSGSTTQAVSPEIELQSIPATVGQLDENTHQMAQHELHTNRRDSQLEPVVFILETEQH